MIQEFENHSAVPMPLGLFTPVISMLIYGKHVNKDQSLHAVLKEIDTHKSHKRKFAFFFFIDNVYCSIMSMCTN